MEEKRKQDLEDEMNRFEQEISGNLPPPPKAPHVINNAPPQPPMDQMPAMPNFIRPPPQNMSFQGGPPPLPPPPMFGRAPMDMMRNMQQMHSMPTMDSMHHIPPMAQALPVPPPMMIPTQLMTMGPPPSMAPGPSNKSKNERIAPPTVPLKNYEVVPHIEEVQPEQHEEMNKEPKSKKSKKKSVLRVAGGVVWEDETLLDWEMNDFRIFVGDLGNEVSDDALLRAFSRYPSILKAKVIRDKKTKKTKGFGFVSFKDPQDYLKAMREMNGKYVGNRPIKLRKSSWKDRNINIAKKKEKEKKKLGLR